MAKVKKAPLTICGLDEAGRGALAGPLFLAAVILPCDFDFKKIAPNLIVKDSKELSCSQRLAVFKIIEKYALKIDTEIISVEEINSKGINWANTEGFRRLIIRNEASQYIVDGRWHLPDLGNKNSLVSCVIGADRTIPATLAAGIVAKIKRDALMRQLHRKYPFYGWQSNTGHGTLQHLIAIKKYEISPYHRLQFVKTALNNFKNNQKWQKFAS
ncbi:MAG: ribonuclease HII [Microgenomates group bacterium]